LAPNLSAQGVIAKAKFILRGKNGIEEEQMSVNKIYETCDHAVADIFDGSTIMIGGFGSFGGLPIHLIVALAKQGAKNLTLIANQGGVGFELSKRIKPDGYQDIGILVQNGQVKKFIGSIPALGGMPPTSPLERLRNDGKVDIEMVPQGTLAERIRAGAGGLGGFYTPTGVGTRVEIGKEKRVSMAGSTCSNCL
jgi:3-oxoacid CoA-transferase A subunit